MKPWMLCWSDVVVVVVCVETARVMTPRCSIVGMISCKSLRVRKLRASSFMVIVDVVVVVIIWWIIGTASLLLLSTSLSRRRSVGVMVVAGTTKAAKFQDRRVRRCHWKKGRGKRIQIRGSTSDSLPLPTNEYCTFQAIHYFRLANLEMPVAQAT